MARVLGALAADYEVHWLGLGHHGAVVAGDGFTLHPTNVGGGDVFAVESGRAKADAIDADVVLLYNDWWLLEKYRRSFDTGPRRSRVVAYCPIDGRITTPAVAEAVGWVDDLVTFTSVAGHELESAAGRPVHVIGHGVDDVGFGPVERVAARASALPGVGPEAFVVLNANRLQPRKRIDVTVAAFAALAADCADAHLVLHHALPGPGDDDERLDRHLASLDPDVAARIHLRRDELPDAGLNTLYNACDVGVNTSAGEGWGLVSFEHALTGAAQVVPGHGACAELWAGAAEVVEPKGPPAVPVYAKLAMQEVTAADVAAALARLHDDPGHRRRIAAAGRARAQEDRFTWAEVGRRWRALLAGPVASRSLAC